MTFYMFVGLLTRNRPTYLLVGRFGKEKQEVSNRKSTTVQTGLVVPGFQSRTDGGRET